MSHTLDQDRIDDFMFDRSGSMDLSRQYFTVLQMLRVAREWIDVSVGDWNKMRNNIVMACGRLEDEDVSRNDRGEPLQEKLDKITQLLTGQVKQLQDRIHTKTEEVKSLRDGVWIVLSFQSISGF